MAQGVDAIAATARERVPCTHCGDSVPAGLLRPGAATQFCCGGCETVYAAISESGLDRYYVLRERLEARGRRVRLSDKDYTEFDDPAFLELHTQPHGEGARTVEWYVENVHCGACVWLLERLPHVESSVLGARMDMRRGLLQLVFDPSRVALSALARRLASFGYPPHPSRGRDQAQLRRRETRRQLMHIAVAGAIAGNVMVLAFPLYGGALHGIESEYQTFFLYLSMGLTWVSLVWPGRTFFRGAWAAWRTKVPHMDVPIAVGLGAGLLLSTAHALLGSREVYFESLCTLVFLLLVGRFIQKRQQQRSQTAVELLFSTAPSSARLVEGDVRRNVPIEALRTGQRVEVLPGESLPVDGVVVSGHSTLDTKWLTGEAAAVPVGPGDRVHAAAVNLSAPLCMEATAIGEATRVGKLMALVEESAARQAPVVGLANRIASVFVVSVLALAAGTALLWWFLEPSRALPNALALLIVTCPCALGLATPLAIVAAIGRAASRDILVRGGDALEALVRPGHLVLDKTGTLTVGTPRVVAWEGDPSHRRAVLALESLSVHPMARALAGMREVEEQLPAVEEFREVQGRGVTGVVEGRRYGVGSLRFAKETGALVPPELLEAVERHGKAGASPLLVCCEGRAVCVLAIADPLHGDARATVDELRSMGWRVSILSGDQPDAVVALGAKLGLSADECKGAVAPEEKLAAIEAYRAQAPAGQPVVMVGDGVNDAAALAAATVGIAVHGGAEASLAAADVYLARGGLAPLLELVRGAGRTFAAIRRNVLVSLGYNAVGVGLAVGGLLDPLVAAVLMPVSSLTVITLSYRARTFPRAVRPQPAP